jgi:hypothetical protein
MEGLALAGLVPAEPPAPAPDPTLRRASRFRDLPPPSPRRSGALLLGIAIVCGVVVLAMRAGAGRGPLLGRGDDTEGGVLQAARRLSSTEPGFFSDFVPYQREQLRNAPIRPRRGGDHAPDPLHPLDDVLSDRPTLLWRPIEGSSAYHVAVRREDGAALFERRVEGHRLAWPADVEALARDAHYAWDVRADLPDAPASAAKFRVASDRQVQHWERRRARLEEHVPDEAVRAVLLAQVALQRGHLWEAWQAIRAHEQRVPKDAYGEALADYLRKMHGYLD